MPRLRPLLLCCCLLLATVTIALAAVLCLLFATMPSDRTDTWTPPYPSEHRAASAATAGVGNPTNGARVAQPADPLARSPFDLPIPTTPAERHAHARLLQTLFCDHIFPLPPSPNATLAPLIVTGVHPTRDAQLSPAGLYVYSGGASDFVSGSVADSGMWELDVAMSVVWALAEAEEAVGGAADPLFVDVGSNVGVHSVVVAANGYRVVAVDGLRANAHLFRSSLCRTPELMDRITFFNQGLGAKSTVCAIASENFNQGDGTITCSPRAIAQYKTTSTPHGLKPFRQWLRIDPLDHLLDEDVWVLKMDVEGFELDVLQGASSLFATRRVHYLITEVNLAKRKTSRMLGELRRLGFSCSRDGFYGRRWTIPPKEKGLDGTGDELFNVWCIHAGNLAAAGLGRKAERAVADV
ncbi:S-adenosyl-L-methionine-dependent methyltransferase [Zopfochytrium polystomum]|nr:S-adenosyl-L-methionine-dependent methyltransferase [Zopfochytrium polystomum]